MSLRDAVRSIPGIAAAEAAITVVADVVDRVRGLGAAGSYLKQAMQNKLVEHNQYIDKHGQDLPEIRNWKWVPTR